MKTAIDVQITDESLKAAGLTYDQILDTSLEELENLYVRYNLEFDCGYNPLLVTNGIRN